MQKSSWGTSQFSAQRLQLLRSLMNEKGTVKDSHAPVLTSKSRPEHLPLSFAQQRLWFIDQLLPGSPLYNILIVRCLTGKLDIPLLQRCFTELLRRHEVLCTFFTIVDGVPTQVIGPSLLVNSVKGEPKSARNVGNWRQS